MAGEFGFPPRRVYDRGACRHHPVEVFFPSRGEDIDTAKAICRQCPVQAPCAAWALQQTTRLTGVWGGLSWRDRRRSNLRQAA